MTTIVMPAAPTIHRVSVFICFVSGVSSLRGAPRACAQILPTSVPAPIAVTTIVALPCVTGVCMKAMFVWSPGAQLAAGQRLGVLAGRHALAGERRLVDLQRAGLDDAPVGRHLVAGREQHDVADDQLLGRDVRLDAVPAHPWPSPSSST